MAVGRINARVDVAELVEARAELKLWRGRVAQLPKHLQDELTALDGVGDGTLFAVESDGAQTVIAATPRLRALLANLRAQGAT